MNRRTFLTLPLLGFASSVAKPVYGGMDLSSSSGGICTFTFSDKPWTGVSPAGEFVLDKFYDAVANPVYRWRLRDSADGWLGAEVVRVAESEGE